MPQNSKIPAVFLGGQPQGEQTPSKSLKRPGIRHTGLVGPRQIRPRGVDRISFNLIGNPKTECLLRKGRRTEAEANPGKLRNARRPQGIPKRPRGPPNSTCEDGHVPRNLEIPQGQSGNYEPPFQELHQPSELPWGTFLRRSSALRCYRISGAIATEEAAIKNLPRCLPAKREVN